MKQRTMVSEAQGILSALSPEQPSTGAAQEGSQGQMSWDICSGRKQELK